MPRISLPPFLKKLQAVTNGVAAEVAHWNEKGDAFIVEKSDGFEQALGQYFKGSLLTFIRQLHFYGFRKVDIKGEKWSFSHKCFRQEMPHLIYEIRRKTRSETNDGVASQSEVQALRDHVGKLHELVKQLQSELRETKDELGLVRQSIKRDSLKSEIYGFGGGYGCVESVSNGANPVFKRRKMLPEKVPGHNSGSEMTKSEDLDQVSLPSIDMSLDNLSTFLPFTDSAIESMALNEAPIM